MRRYKLTRRYAVIAAYALLALSCENALGPTSGEDVARVTVDPATMNLVAGNSQPATASVLDASGQVLSGRTVIWSTQNAAVATVTQSGTVTAVSSGTTQVAASAGGKSGIIDVTVSGRPVALVRVTPQATQILVGSTRTLTAEILDAQGDPVAGRVPVWSSSNNNIATVSQAGVVTGVSAGSATISAAVGSVSGSSNVSVVSVPVDNISIAPNGGHLSTGQTLQLTATTKDKDGNVLQGRLVSWESSNDLIATVSSNGLVRAFLPGNAKITATSEGKTDQVTINVTAAAVSSVEVTPSQSTITTGKTAQLSARLTDATGNVLTGRTVVWSSGQAAIATVTQGGLVTGVAQGSAQIFAESEGIKGSATVDVTAVAVSSVTVTPSPLSLSVGQSQALTATARDASGNVLTGRQTTWDSDNPLVASVSSTGVVTGVLVGVTAVNATIGGVSKGVPVTVNLVPVSSIVVTPSPATVEEGQTLQLTATAKDASGNTLTGRTITWTSSNPQVSVSSAGLVTAVANSGGQGATITASSPGGGLGGSTPSGVATITVTYAPVATIDVAPSSPTVTLGGTTSLVPTLKDAGGQLLSLTGRTVTWSSANPGVASVSSTGVVTGVSLGSTIITAKGSSPGQATPASKDVTVTVSPAAVATVEVSPGPTATVHAGALYARTFTFTAKSSSGTVIPGRTATWSSNNLAAATVDPSTGVVTGVAPGTARIDAVVDGVTGSSTVTVDLVAVSTVDVTPSTATLTPPETQQLSAVAQDSAGNPITGAALGGRTTAWASNSAAATVDANGLVTAQGLLPGSAIITATIGGTAGTATITVLAPAASVDLTVAPDSVIAPGSLTGFATVRDAANAPLAGRNVNFASATPSRATVAPSSATTNGSGQASLSITGVAAAAGPVTVNITATSGIRTSPAFAARILNPVASVVYSSATDSIIGTGTIATTLSLKDAFNNTITGRPVAFSSTNPSVASATAGSVNAIGFGNATISASSEGKSDAVAIRVLEPVATVTAVAPVDSIFAGGTVQATTTLRSASNNVLTGRPVSWSTSAPSVATVNATSGLITGVAPGDATMSAVSEGKTGTLDLRVIPGITSIVLSAPSDSLIGSGTLSVTATATGSGGVPIQGRVLAASSGSPAVATVSPPSGATNASGVLALTVTQAGTGTSTISVTAEGKTGTLAVRMLAPVSVVQLTAAVDSIIGIGSVATSVVLRDASNNVLTGRPVSYTASNPSLITVSASGLVTSLTTVTSDQSVTVTAVSEGVSSAPVTIRLLRVVSSVQVTPSSATVHVGSAYQRTLAAVTRDASNNIITGRAISWSSSATAFATVGSATGVVTGVAPGSATITASSGAISGSASVTVDLVDVSTVTVSPGSKAMFVGDVFTFTAIARDSAGSAITGTALGSRSTTWSIPPGTTKATLNTSTGALTAEDSGSVIVTATIDGKSGTGIANISLVPVASISIVPASAISVSSPLGTASRTARVRDANGNNAIGRACTLTSSNALVATVSPSSDLTDSNGQIDFTVHGLIQGNAVVSITCEGIVETVNVSVS